MRALKLGILDQSPIREGGTAAAAFSETLRLAQAADRLGYHRFWVAEHHNTKSFAGSAPEIMIARIAAETQRVRVGAGGIMLPHYSPLKVAEIFRVLETLYPGRIDLGLGRAPGSDAVTSRALQAGPEAWPIDAYPQAVALLRLYLEEAAGEAEWPDGHTYAKVHAAPRGPGVPPLWLLGSGVHSALYAAEMGLPFSFAHFIARGDEGPEILEAYRQRFKPRKAGDRPQANACVFALACETAKDAAYEAATRNLWVLQLLTGKAGAFPAPETAKNYPYTDEERSLIKAISARGITGTAAEVRAGLQDFAGRYGVDEVLVLTITYDFAARLRSYELIAEAMLEHRP